MSAGPLPSYQNKIASGDLAFDAGQEAVISALDSLYHELCRDTLSPSLWQRFLKTPPAIKGLYLYGGVGRGKSMLMDLFYDELPAGVARRVHFHDFMVMAHDKMNEMRQKQVKDPVAETAKALANGIHVLCFDEMEVRDIADAMIVKRLFDGLFANHMTIVATSNRHPDELYKGGLHRDRFMPFISQIKEHCHIQEIADGQDWRERLLGTSPRWYCPADKASLAHMESQFAHVTGQDMPDELVVKVAGRDIVFDKVAHNIAFVTFDELCAVPLGARDYVALADRLTGLFITHIPQMDDALQNEARRFMWLIDALYDRRRFIVASAETEMDKIYQGRQWAFEFERTTSRLSEMSRLSSDTK